MMLKRTLTLLPLLVVVIGIGSVAAADVIYDNGGPLTGFGYVSDVDSIGRSADGFVLADGLSVLGDIHWYGYYYMLDETEDPNPSYESTPFEITIYEDANGLPGDVVWEDFTSIVQQDTGADVEPVPFEIPPGVNIYEYDYVLDDPLTLLSGRPYWLSVYADTSENVDDHWAWCTSVVPVLDAHAYKPAMGPDRDWQAAPNELAFYLTGPRSDGIIPEPATLGMVGAGLAGLAARSLVRRARRR